MPATSVNLNPALPYPSGRRPVLGTRVHEPTTSLPGSSGGLSSGLGDLLSDTVGFFEPIFEPVLGVGKAIGELIVGVVGLVAGTLLAYMFKDHTGADLGSKTLAIVGLLFSILGIKDLMGVNKKAKTAHVVEPHYIKVSDGLSTQCKQRDKQLTVHDPAFKNVINPEAVGYLYNNQTSVPGQDLRPGIVALLNCYTDAEFISQVKSDSKGAEPAFDNLTEGYPVTLGQYRDRVAVMLGNLVTSRTADDPLTNSLFSDLLTVQDLSGDRISLLPPEFVGVFNIGRNYADNHRNNNNSLDAIIGGESEVAEIKKLNKAPIIGTSYHAVFAYINQLQRGENDLKVMSEIIKYVLDNSNTADVTVARDVMILRQALACAFRITGRNIGQINTVLRGILKGEQSTTSGAQPYDGIEKKLGKLNARFEVLDEQITDDSFPFEQVAIETENSDVLGGVMLQEFVEKSVI